MNYIHANLADGRWQKMNIVEQLANIGSEYSRAKKWKEKGNEKLFWGAMDRMLELLDFSIVNNTKHRGKLRELTRLKELISIELLGNEGNIQPGDWTGYFLRMGELANKRNNK